MLSLNSWNLKMPKKLILNFKLIDYWIDYKTKKAYCILIYLDFKDEAKKSNLHLIESIYDDK